MTPYYADDQVTLYYGDCRDILPSLGPCADAAVADPPYQETVAAWDRWPDGWVKAVAAALPTSASLWCFGTAAMFLDRAADFTGWRLGQEALWLKRNGSGPGSTDRLLKVHEWAYHWYRGRWSDLHHEWERELVYAADNSTRRTANAVPHRRPDRTTAYVDDGYRLLRSVRVIEAPSVRYQKRHQAEKPLKVVAELVRECTPPGGIVLDAMAGSGTTGIAASMTGRRAVLIEAHEPYCELTARRLSQNVLPLLPNT